MKQIKLIIVSIVIFALLTVVTAKSVYAGEQADAKGWNNKGIELGKLGKYEEGIKAFDKSIKSDPKYAPAWNNKGIALAKLGKYEEGIKAFDKAIRIDPNYAKAWNNKGIALEKLGKHNEALMYFEKVRELMK